MKGLPLLRPGPSLAKWHWAVLLAHGTQAHLKESTGFTALQRDKSVYMGIHNMGIYALSTDKKHTYIYIYTHVYIYTCRSIPRILRLRDLFDENTVLKALSRDPRGYGGMYRGMCGEICSFGVWGSRLQE